MSLGFCLNKVVFKNFREGPRIQAVLQNPLVGNLYAQNNLVKWLEIPAPKFTFKSCTRINTIGTRLLTCLLGVLFLPRTHTHTDEVLNMKARGDTVGVEVRRDGGCRSRDVRALRRSRGKLQCRIFTCLISSLSSKVDSVNITAERGFEIESCVVPFHKINSTLSVRTFQSDLSRLYNISILELKLWLQFIKPTWSHQNIRKLWGGGGVGFYNWTFVCVASPFI